MKKFLLTTAAFGMLALPAMAADMPVYKAPDPDPDPDPGAGLPLVRVLYRW
jgi:hypothetical protein